MSAIDEYRQVGLAACEHPRMVYSVLTKVLLIITDGLTKEDCIAMHLFLTEDVSHDGLTEKERG